MARETNTANWMAGLNEGLRCARGDYVCFLQHDDYWLDGRLRAARAPLAREPEVVLLLHAARFVDRAGSGSASGIAPCPLAGPSRPRRSWSGSSSRTSSQSRRPIFRREVALGVGGLDEALWYSADWDFWLKLAAAGRTVYLAEALSAYRIHNNSMTWWRTDEQIAEQRRQLEQVLDWHSNALEMRRPIPSAVRRAAWFSVEVNTTLAAHAHRPGIPVIGLGALSSGWGPRAGIASSAIPGSSSASPLDSAPACTVGKRRLDPG